MPVVVLIKEQLALYQPTKKVKNMMLSSKIKQGICCATHSLLLCVLTLGAGVTAADDTDVFFGQTLDDQETRPNVLLVLDTSGSMSRTDGGVTSRLSRMKAAVRQILESDIDMNIGLMGYNGNGGGGPILYPVTNLGDVVCSGLDCENVDVREDVYDVDGGLGDIEETLNGGNIDSGGNTLSLGSSGMGPQGLGLRFADINVFRGATILDAHIQFVARRTEADDADFIIEVEDVGDAQAYGTTVGELSSRQYSTNTLLWNPEEWNQNVAYETIDVGQLVQSVITRSDWCNGNALSFKISGTGTRRASSWESAAANSELIPKLRIRLDNSSAVAAFGCGNSVTSALAPIVAPDSGLGVPGVAGIASQLTAAEIAVARSEMLQVIDDLTSVGGTPTVDALYEAALYMRGEGVHFGGFRGVTTRNSRKERFRVSHQDSYTGGTLVREADCTDDNLNARACVGEQIIGDAQYISPIGGSCQPNHIVLLSDGNPRGTVLQPEIQSLIGQSQCSGAGSEACAVDLASWLNSADQSNDFDAVQSIITSTIAFNLDGDSDFLESVALAGGGIAYDAASTDELIAVFGEIAENVADVDASFTAPAATVNQFNRLSHRDDLYFALFRPEVKPRWNGNIKRFKLGAENDGSGDVLIRDRDGYPAIDENTGNFSIQSRSFWPGKNDDGTVNNEADGANVAEGGAANQLALTGLQGIGARRVYTWTGDPSIEISTPVDLTAVEQRFHESNTEITDELLGIEGQGANSTEQAELRENLIKWARGVDVLDSDTDGSVVDARRQMGDPMHSRPVVVNYAIPGNSDAVRSLVFVGTNEGYLHALDADSGEEQFAFVPGELLKNHDTFFSDSSSFKRPYGLDGPISVWRDDVNDNQTVDTGDSAFLSWVCVVVVIASMHWTLLILIDLSLHGRLQVVRVVRWIREYGAILVAAHTGKNVYQ